jgi:flagellar biosynthesis protein FlhG
MPYESIQQPPAAKRCTKPKVIAVGGAKGGIGKSVLSANLGVYLASRGWRTTVVDMDLGAANLHLYLGIWGLKHRINDYLDKKVEDLEQIAVETAYGPRLIGGGSSRLGSANLPFARKLKLMRAIGCLDADFVIIDLGGDTTFNVLDFFLLADHGLVLTSCDPASYLDAYTFVKMSLYRRLTRIFGPESIYRKFRDNDLINLINHYIGPEPSRNGGPAYKIQDLMLAISQQAPARKYLIQKAIDQFQPHLVVNMVEIADEVDPLVERFQNVSSRMLSIKMGYAGSIPADRHIARSTHDLTPAVARHPNGLLADFLGQLLAQL